MRSLTRSTRQPQSDDVIVEPGESVALELTLQSRTTGLFPVANVRNSVGAAIAGPFSLAAVGGFPGRYLYTYTAPATPGAYVVFYDVYTDVGHTTLSTRDGPAEDELIVRELADIPGQVWNADVADFNIAGSFGQLVRTAAQVAGKSNYRIDNFVYNVNGFLTSCRIRTFPNAATASASTAGGSGEGELDSITVTGSPNGTYTALPTTVLGVKS